MEAGDGVVAVPMWVKVFVFLTCWPAAVFADPMLVGKVDNAIVTIHSEECAFKDVVVNLPQRATWVENGKSIEGCAGYSQALEVVFFYFRDKTMFGAPGFQFARVTGV